MSLKTEAKHVLLSPTWRETHLIDGVFQYPSDSLFMGDEPTGNGQAADRDSWKGSPLRVFIGGPENTLVREAVQSLEDPKSPYNPLVLFGPTGVGKSLLVHGMMQIWQERHREKATLLSAADFARLFRTALQTNTVEDLRDKRLRTSLLVIEDLQALQGRRNAQQELTHWLDTLLPQGRRIIVTCRSQPASLPGIESTLSSRLSGGLLVPVAPPAQATRREILRRLAEARSLEIHEDTLELMAEQVTGAALELNHVVSQLAHQAEIQGACVDQAAVEQLLAQLRGSPPSPAQIAKHVSKYFAIKIGDLKGPSRRQAVVRARGAAAYLMRSLSGMSFHKIGHCLGKRDHSTIMNACHKTEMRIIDDPAFGASIEELKERLTKDESSKNGFRRGVP